MLFGAIQELRNATGLGVYGLAQISVTKVHGPMLLVLRGGVKFAGKKALRNT